MKTLKDAKANQLEILMVLAKQRNRKHYEFNKKMQRNNQYG